jgi:hypothetical protein
VGAGKLQESGWFQNASKFCEQGPPVRYVIQAQGRVD